MKLVYSLERPPDNFHKSIFLAGPTPRSPGVKSWRPKAISLLRKHGYDGVVFVPEDRKKTDAIYDAGAYPEWEHRMMDMSDCIMFWIPRDLKTLPGFTTNVEFGLYSRTGKIIMGAPETAPSTRYLRLMSDKFYIPNFTSLEDTVNESLRRLGPGALRSGGEREIPYHIWRLRAFQNWYQAQLNAGNRLDGAKVEWMSTVRNNPEAIFAFAIRPNVHITSENRNKFNDPVIFRLDISTVLLYQKAEDIWDTKIVLVREFRNSGSTKDGFIWELPGGSSPAHSDPIKVAVEELREEICFRIEEEELIYEGARQLAGTLSAHKAHLFSAELRQFEVDWLYSQKNVAHGADLNNTTGERAYTEIKTLREIISEELLDWSNIGMILAVITRQV